MQCDRACAAMMQRPGLAYSRLRTASAARRATRRVPSPSSCPTRPAARPTRWPAIMAERMKAALGQSVIIENVTGAGGSIGVGRVARAAPDGYTISIGHNQTHVINARDRMNLNYDVVKDFEPVALIADTPIWIIAKQDPAGQRLQGVHRLAQGQRRKATAGAVGVGGPNDIAGTFVPEADRHDISSSCPIAAARRCCRTCWRARSTSLRAGGELSGPRPQRPAQGLRGADAEALVGGARRADP